MTKEQTVLLVDDCENDSLLMRIAFDKAQFESVLQCVDNGEKAIAYLNGDGPFGDRNNFPLPTVALLDLNMPKKTGFDVLAWVRTQPDLKRIPIIVVTASAHTADVERAFDLGANGYLVKPSEVEQLVGMVRCLRQWLEINQFPPLHQGGKMAEEITHEESRDR